MLKKNKFQIAPFILIVLGVVFILNNLGILPWEIWNNLWKFWPVILILFGVELLLGQSVSIKTFIVLLILIFLIPIIITYNPFNKNPFATDKLEISQDLGSLTKARIVIDLPATKLALSSLASGSAKLIEGKIEYSKAADRPTISEETNFGQSIFTLNQVLQKGIPFVSSLKNTTNLSFTQSVPLEIVVKTGAAQGTINLEYLRADYLEVESKASNLKIIFGKEYSSRAIFKTSASNIEIEIPKEAAARIKIDSNVKNLSIDSRFKNKAGTYQTENFEKSFTRLDIVIEAIASSINIK